jgi:hypothetical protein
VVRLYNERLFVAREIREKELGVQKSEENCCGRTKVKRMGIQTRTTEYSRENEN